MVVKKSRLIFVAGILTAVSTAAYAGACSNPALDSDYDAKTAHGNTLEKRIMEPGGCALIPELVAYVNNWDAKYREYAKKFGCGLVPPAKSLSNKIKEWHASCGGKKSSTSLRSTQTPNCSTPTSPSATRTNPTNMCFTAKNNNTDPRCTYSYTYFKGAKRIDGGNVEAGQSDSQCSLTSGVDIAFEKWTKVGGSAR